MLRWIAHLDMDAFYASVELTKYPELRGRAVVVGGRRLPAAMGAAPFARLGDYAGRGVVTTATYEARALGIHSAMGMMKAARLAPDAVLLPADFDSYRRVSREFKDAVRTLCPIIEDRGIDEIYIDLQSHLTGPISFADSVSPVDDTTPHLAPLTAEAAMYKAARLKCLVRDATGLGCSIAVAPNKLLAKIGSDLDKPDGLTLIDEAALRARIWPLPVGRIPGVGPKAQQQLAQHQIETIGELAARSRDWLVDRFGQRQGQWLHESAQGWDDRPIVTSQEPKSVSRETTFERDLDPRLDRAELSARFTELCLRVGQDLERKQLFGRTIGIKLRFADFSTVTRDLTLPDATREPGRIRAAAGQCLKRVDLGRRIRLLGVRVGALQYDSPQGRLFTLES